MSLAWAFCCDEYQPIASHVSDIICDDASGQESEREKTINYVSVVQQGSQLCMLSYNQMDIISALGHCAIWREDNEYINKHAQFAKVMQRPCRGHTYPTTIQR